MPSYGDQLQDFVADLKSLFVGDRTFGDAVVPPIVFVIAQNLWGIRWGAALALATAALFVGLRYRKRASVAYALGGVATVGFALFLAIRSGDAEDFFLPGIVSAFLLATGGAVSIAVRRPFIAFVSAFYRRWPFDWYWRSDVRPAYTVVSWWWAAYTLGRGIGQLWLFVDDRLELLLTFKLLTSWPLGVPLMFASYVYGNRKLHRLGGPNIAEYESGAESPFVGEQHGF